MKAYKDIRYAANRLNGTIVRYKDTPVFVIGGEGADTFVVEYLHNRVKDVAKAKDLDINPVPLGYVNYDNRMTYLSRMPKRKDWRQGLRENNVYTLGDYFRDIPMNCLSDCILGKYGTIEDAVKVAKKGYQRAFHREWGVEREDRLIYKGREVGVYYDQRLILNDNAKFLEEKLMEAQHENYIRNL